MSEFNPYEYMLEIRNNRVLFQYLENASVNFSDNEGWSIQGISDEGITEIYEVAGALVRLTLPISVPEFITVDVLHRIVDGLNTSIEGICTVAEENDALFLEYHIHINPFNPGSLDAALLKFVGERSDIRKGFQSLAEEYNQMKEKVNDMMEGLGQAMSGIGANPSTAPGDVNVTTDTAPNMDGLWNEMENIDRQLDDEDEDDTQAE